MIKHGAKFLKDRYEETAINDAIRSNNCMLVGYLQNLHKDKLFIASYLKNSKNSNTTIGTLLCISVAENNFKMIESLI